MAGLALKVSNLWFFLVALAEAFSQTLPPTRLLIDAMAKTYLFPLVL